MSLSTTFSSALLIAASTLAAGATAQENPRRAEPAPETVEQPSATGSRESESRESESVDDLIDRLGDANYRARKSATERLTEIGAGAVEDLRHAAEDHDDPEVRMRAERILGRIERGDRGTARGLRRREGGAPWRKETDADNIREMVERAIEEALPDHPGLGRQLEGLEIPQIEWFQRGGANPLGGAWSSRDSVSIEVGPNGVRVEVDAAEGDEEDAKVYEAADMETFRKQYPEVAKRYFGGGRGNVLQFGTQGRQGELGLQGFPGIQDRRTQQQVRRWLQPLEVDVETEAAPPAGERLGVYVEELHPVLAEFLGFDEGAGLRVSSVEDDSLADQLGVKAGDVLIEVDGQRIDARSDVAAALREVAAGEDVVVLVNRRGREVKLRTEKG